MAEAGEQVSSSRTYRILLVAVIVMGVVLVLGFVFVFSTIAYRLSKRGGAAQTPAALTLDGAPRSFSLDGDRLAVLVATPEGDAIVIYDLRSGKETQRLRFLARPP